MCAPWLLLMESTLIAAIHLVISYILDYFSQSFSVEDDDTYILWTPFNPSKEWLEIVCRGKW